MDITKMSDVVAIKRFFELNCGRRVSLAEIQQLTQSDKAELGKLAKVELATV